MVRALIGLGRLLLQSPPAQRSAAWAEIKPILRARWLQSFARRPTAKASVPILFQMASGFWLSQAVYVAAKLGIADLLAEGPQSTSQLAFATGCHPDSLRRLMRALVEFGLFSQLEDDHFVLASLGESLRAEAPGSLQATVITLGEIHYQACGQLLHSVRTGGSSFNEVFGSNLFDYLGQNSAAASSFNSGMAELSALLAYAVLSAYDFSGIESVVDVGGGEGELMNRILQFYPATKGTVFDLPTVVERARQTERIRPRCSYVAGDFFDYIPPGADLYVLSGVIHDWSDACALRILRNCRRASERSSRLLLLEMIVPAAGGDFSKILDLNMLVMNGGRVRTKSEVTTLLHAAGYKVNRIIPTLAPQSLIEALPE